MNQLSLFPNQVNSLRSKKKHQSWKDVVRKREGYKCYFAKGDNLRDHSHELNIHHVLPKKYGGKDEPSNGILLCRNCHAAQHVDLEQRYFAKNIWYYKNFILDQLRSIMGKPQKLQYYMALKLLTGKDKFRSGQERIITDIIEHKKSVLVVMPTGSGKSILYQIPGILSGSQTLVLSPLISLMMDQVQHLQSSWVPCTYINSTLSKVEKRSRLNLILERAYSFVFAHPKQFLSLDSNKRRITAKYSSLFMTNYAYLVVDEVHLAVTWGRSFVSEYAHLNIIKKRLGNPQLILLTATANKRMQTKIKELLGNSNVITYVGGFYRPEIKLRVIRVDENLDRGRPIDRKLTEIKRIIKETNSGKVLIFVPTIGTGKDLQRLLRDTVIVDFYHGRLDKEKKILIQNKFNGKYKTKETNVLLATSAFGMGVDIPNIRHVIHYSMPSNLIDYYQQAGRAGRDRKTSYATLLYQKGDERINNFLNEINLKTKTDLVDRKHLEVELKTELNDMLGYIYAEDKWQFILDYFNDQVKWLTKWWLKIKQFLNDLYN